jgi:hypothetical protein
MNSRKVAVVLLAALAASGVARAQAPQAQPAGATEPEAEAPPSTEAPAPAETPAATEAPPLQPSTPPSPQRPGWGSIGALRATGPSHATEEAVRVGATYSDNIGRTETDKVSDTTPEVDLRFGATERRPNFTADLASDLEYQDYLKHTFPSRVIGGVVGSGSVAFVPQSFDWFLQDNFGQTRSNALAVETPNNRQNVNYFTTGPDLSVPLTGPTSLLMQARWSKASYQVGSGDDQQQTSGTIGLDRKLGANSSLSLNVSALRTRFAESVGIDFNVESAYFQYATLGRRASLVAQFGYTELHDLGHKRTQPLLSIALSRAVTSRTMLTLDAGTNFSDSAQLFRTTQQLGGIILGSNDVVATADALRSDHGALGWSYNGNRTTVQFRVDWQRDRHERYTTEDRKRTGSGLNISRRLTPRVTLGIGGSYGRQNFDALGVTLDDWWAETTLSWQMSRYFSLIANASRYGGSGPNVNLLAYRYTENRASLMLVYGRSH